jgi:hypothetical protein
MPSRFTSGMYDPELVKKMSNAATRVWGGFEPRPQNESVASSLIASAISEAIDDGSSSPDEWRRRATLAWQRVNKINPDCLASEPNK